jgi:4-hydroxy-2-oxoglutarate aldolase
LQSLAETLIYVKQAARLGANVALVNPPFYFKNAMTPARLQSFFNRVADESPIPILLYNVPQYSGLTIPPQIVAHLAEHPNIIGIKDSSGDIAALEHLLRLTPPAFNVLVGSAYAFYPGLMLGAHGAVLALSFIAWEACLELMDAVQSQQHANARDIQMRLATLAVTLDIPGLKAALELRGLFGGPPRSPLAPVTPERRNEILQALINSGLIPGLES